MPAGRFNVRQNKLTIENVRYADEGFYVCEAENFLGKLYELLDKLTKEELENQLHNLY